jgi:predicted metalloendopeptidase
MAEAARQRDLDKIGKPTDKTEWNMTAPTVNAFYSQSLNSINFPAGILQLPFFDPHRDMALNYGAIGTVIGHEMTHGFDDQGRKFDGDGNLRDWWTAADGAAFETRAACIADEYSGFTAVDDVKLNGKLTLGENTADNGGARVAYMAMENALNGKGATIDGYTPEQRFFLGFGQVWCENQTPQFARQQALTDPHSPGRFRVNRHGGEHARVPESVLVQGRPADGQRQRLPGLVEARWGRRFRLPTDTSEVAPYPSFTSTLTSLMPAAGAGTTSVRAPPARCAGRRIPAGSPESTA